MDDEEVLRRIRALVAMPQRKRPISVSQLALIAGVSPLVARTVAERGRMMKGTRVRFERALKLIENGQVSVRFPGGRAGGVITVRDEVRPPQVNIRRIEFTAKGPQVRMVAVNPFTFPVLDPIDKALKKG